jgi:hypothetical protein
MEEVVMKVLYVDPTSPIGHINYNYGLLRSLSKFCTLDVLIRKNYLDLDISISVNNIHFISDHYIPELILSKCENIHEYRIKMRLAQLRLLIWIRKNYFVEKYDLIIFSSVEIISFSIATLGVRSRYAFVDHGISDVVNSFLRKFFWMHLNHNAEIIVMESYIKSYLNELTKKKNKIWVIPHPLPSKRHNINDDDLYNKQKTQNLTILFAPGLSNDEGFIEFLIQNQKRIPDSYKIIIRSKKSELRFNNLEVYRDRINDDVYIDTIKKSTYILLPYYERYNFRNSGVLYEAAFYRKPMIVNNVNTLNYYYIKYPEAMVLFKGGEEFLNLLERLKDQYFNNDISVFDNILKDHSNESIDREIKKLLDID